MTAEVCEQEAEAAATPENVKLDSLSIAELRSLIDTNEKEHRRLQKNLRSYLRVREDMQ
jgi:hypothetical protein